MTGAKLQKARRASRTHTFGGCATCRRRHVKCDQFRPECLTCKAVGVKCDGFSSDLRWVSETSKLKDGIAVEVESTALNATRRHLFSEQSRLSMSEALSAGLTFGSVDASLSELETKVRDLLETPSRDIAIGPFGILDLSMAPVTPSVPRSTATLNDTTLQLHHENLAERYEGNPDASPRTVRSVESSNQINDFLDWSDLFELDFSPADLQLDTSGAAVSSVAEPRLQSTTADLRHGPIPNVTWNASMPGIAIDGLSVSMNSVLDLRSLGISDLDAQLLLKNFSAYTVPHMSSLPVTRKTPWRTANMCSAVQTLAKISYLEAEDTTHAMLANLLALLAISARHLSSRHDSLNSSSRVTWSKVSIMAITRAKQHLQQSLQHETQGGRKAKYKDQLMAIQAMTAFAINSDQQRDARCYIIDAERLLRTRGLAKRCISRKARLLHHVYTWIRIVGESTYVLRDNTGKETLAPLSTRRRSLRSCKDGNGGSKEVSVRNNYNSRLDDFLRLKQHVLDEPLASGPKERNIGLYDIHLEDDRHDPETMYLELYGISETWLSLVSQTTRLANVIEHVGASKRRKDTNFADSIQHRTERLEDMVCTFSLTHRHRPGAILETRSANRSHTPDSARACMIRALNAALVIFFYRRIKNVHPMMLKEHVDTVIEALKEFDDALINEAIDGPGSPWPAFFAGCESLLDHQRQYLADWMTRAYDKTGFDRFKTIRSIMREVWRRRDEFQTDKRRGEKPAEWTWIHVARERNIYPMLA